MQVACKLSSWVPNPQTDQYLLSVRLYSSSSRCIMAPFDSKNPAAHRCLGHTHLAARFDPYELLLQVCTMTELGMRQRKIPVQCGASPSPSIAVLTT